MQLAYDDLAAFLRRERNSLHYQAPAAITNEFGRGYTTAIDGIAARMLREFRGAPGFDERRFLALVEGKIQ